MVSIVAVAVMLPLGKETSEGNVGATVALIVGLLFIQGCTRVALAVKSAAIPDVLSGKDLLQGNGLSQAGGALFQVVGIGFAFGAAAAFPSWIVVVIGAGVLVVGCAGGETAPADGDGAARDDVRPGGEAGRSPASSPA